MPHSAADWSREFGLANIREGLAALIDNAAPGAAERIMTDSAAFLELIAVSELVNKESAIILREMITAARKAGISWEQIGSELGLSRNEAMERFTAKDSTALALIGTRNIDSGYLPNDTRLILEIKSGEMPVLTEIEKYGWHLIAFDETSWTIEKSDHQWEHRRTVRKKAPGADWHRIGGQAELYDEGLVIFGYIYWKRPLAAPALPGEPHNQAYLKAKAAWVEPVEPIAALVRLAAKPRIFDRA